MLDVKFGSGASISDRAEARNLAQMLVSPHAVTVLNSSTYIFIVGYEGSALYERNIRIVYTLFVFVA